MQRERAEIESIEVLVGFLAYYTVIHSNSALITLFSQIWRPLGLFRRIDRIENLDGFSSIFFLTKAVISYFTNQLHRAPVLALVFA